MVSLELEIVLVEPIVVELDSPPVSPAGVGDNNVVTLKLPTAPPPKLEELVELLTYRKRDKEQRNKKVLLCRHSHHIHQPINQESDKDKSTFTQLIEQTIPNSENNPKTKSMQ